MPCASCCEAHDDRTRFVTGGSRNLYRSCGISCCSVSAEGVMDPISRAQTYVIIPAYNEGRVIFRVVSEVSRAGYIVIVVDDGSSDATAEQAQTAGATVIRHPFNLGQGAALQSGIDYALAQAAECIVTFDADGQHRVSDISRLTDALMRERVGFALGSWFPGPST